MRILKPVKIAPEQKKRYEEYCAKHNLVMFLPIALGVLMAEIVIVVFQFVRLGPLLFDIFYCQVYVSAIVVSAVFSVLYLLYRMKKLTAYQRLVDVLFVVSYLWLALMTTMAETISLQVVPQNMIFTAMIIVIASIVYLDYKVTMFILSVGNIGAIVISILPSFASSEEVLQNDVFTAVLNLVFVFVATIFISIPCYNNRTNSFLQEELLEQTNQSLKGSNSKLQSLNKQLERTVMIDALTGVSNRFAFDKVLKVKWQEAKNTQQPIGVLMLDIDYFKQYNDNYGHIEGDTCLQKVAATIAREVRSGGDNVFRYGGEEFVILLPNTNLEGTILTAQRVQRAIRTLALPHVVGDRIVTLSIGAYSMVPVDDQEYTLIEKADKALYQAKTTGKNRYMVFDRS